MNSISPTFTIGICFRNPGKHFAIALKSVFAQTYSNWELLLLNDISTDGALELALELDDPRVRVLNDGLGKSLNLRLNEMVRAARGRYFVRMDADDIMHPARLEKQLLVLETHGDTSVVGSACYSINLQDQVLGLRPASDKQEIDFRARHSFHHPTVAAPTSWFARNPYSEQYIYSRSEDAELWCRTASQSQFIRIQEPLLFYREASSSFSTYLQSELVLTYLLRERFAKPRHTYLWLLTKQLVKVWAASVLEATGKESLLFRQRYNKLDPELKERAQIILAQIGSTQLPIVRQPIYIGTVSS